MLARLNCSVHCLWSHTEVTGHIPRLLQFNLANKFRTQELQEQLRQFHEIHTVNVIFIKKLCGIVQTNNVNSTLSFFYKYTQDKKVLLRERKRHTAHHVAIRWLGVGVGTLGYPLLPILTWVGVPWGTPSPVLTWVGRYLGVPPVLTWVGGRYLGVPHPPILARGVCTLVGG